jgi:hypothetical protein
MTNIRENKEKPLGKIPLDRSRKRMKMDLCERMGSGLN